MKGLVPIALLVLASACSPAHPPSAPTPQAHTFAGGCAGTVLTDAEPPAWAQGGWTHQKGAPWPVPWAFGTNKTTVAFLFAKQLVAGLSPRTDGTNNKVLWEAQDYPSGANVSVEANPMGQPQPVVRIAGGPSIDDVPTPGCWTFRLSWSAQSSTVNLEVLPAGSLPY